MKHLGNHHVCGASNTKVWVLIWIGLTAVQVRAAVTLEGQIVKAGVSGNLIYDGTDPYVLPFNVNIGTGRLTITGGSDVIIQGDVNTGAKNGASISTVTVTGAGSTLMMTGTKSLRIGGWTKAATPVVESTVTLADSGRLWVPRIISYRGSMITGDGIIDMNSPGMENRGIIAPGYNGIGTLTVNGAVVMTGTSNLVVEVGNTAGNADKLLVNGAVTIQSGATLTPIPAELIQGQVNHVVIGAGTLSGSYSIASTSPMLTVSTAVVGNDVVLTVAPVPFDTDSLVETANQRGVAGALQDMLTANPNALLTQLQGAQDTQTLQGQYDQLSGQSSLNMAPITGVTVTGAMETVAARLGGIHAVAAGRSFDEGPAAETGFSRSSQQSPLVLAQGFGSDRGQAGDKRMGLWARAFDLQGDRETRTANMGCQYKAQGVGVGADYRYADTWLWGLSGGYTTTSSSHDNDAQGDMEGYHLGVYGSHWSEGWYVDMLLQGAYQDYRTQRTVTAGSFTEQNIGNTSGRTLGGYVEAGAYMLERPLWSLRPLAALRVTHALIDGYTETGGSITSLRVDEQTMTSVKVLVGLKVIRRFHAAAENAQSALSVRAGWEHEFGDTSSSTSVAFNSLPTSAFEISGTDISKESLLVGTGIHGSISPFTWLSLTTDYRYNMDGQALMICGTLTHRW